MKNILSIVRGWVVVGVVLGSGVASTALSQTNQNCVSKLDDYANIKVLSATVPCDDRGPEGKGAIVYIGNRGKIAQWGYWKNGNPIGMHIRFHSGFGLVSYSENGKYSGSTFWMRGTPKEADFKKTFNDLLLRGSNSKLIGLENDEAFNELNNWRLAGGNNPASIAKVASTGTLPAFTNAPSAENTNQRESMADDPKVFGRSARGG